MVKVNSINSPGVVIQSLSASTSALVTCTTVIPEDDTIPQQTEGDEVLTLSITPKSATNLLEIIFNTNYGRSSGSGAAALFQDSTANALAAGFAINYSPSSVSLSHTMTAGTTSSTTFKIRMGGSTGGITYYVNGSSGTTNRVYGGVGATELIIKEYLV